MSLTARHWHLGSTFQGPLPLPHSYRKPSLVSPDEGAAASSPPRAAVFGQSVVKVRSAYLRPLFHAWR